MPRPNPNQDSRKLPSPLPNAYWVEPGRLMAGEYPGASSESGSRTNLSRLMEAGVTFFIDLTFPAESSLLPYETLLPELTSRLGRLPGYLRFPIEDMSAALESQVAATLAALETLLTSGETVYLHCYAGRGRTGTLVGCYLVEHGWSGEEALNQIQRLRQSTCKWVAPSPETSGQMLRVLTWYPH